MDIKEIADKLEEYKANLAKVQIALKKNEEKIQDDESKIRREKDLAKLMADIEKAISIQQDLLSVSSSKVNDFFISVKLKAEDIGKKCNLYYEKDQKWYPGQIVSLNLAEQTAECAFLGFNERYLLPASFIQILVPPKKGELREGMDIEVLLEDGKWHYASIENIQDSVEVKLARWGHKQIVSLDSIRLVTDDKKPLIEKDVFIIPEKLKILPNDPENVRTKKKKKIKALRQAWKSNQTDKETKFYTSGWRSFQKAAGVKKSMFRTPDNFLGKIGVIGSGSGMTEKPKTNVEDFNEE